MPHVERAVAGFANERVCFRQQTLERFAALCPVPQRAGAFGELIGGGGRDRFATAGDAGQQ